MQSTEDDTDDFQVRSKGYQVKRSVSETNSSDISNSVLDKYTNNEDVKTEPGYSTNVIKV